MFELLCSSRLFLFIVVDLYLNFAELIFEYLVLKWTNKLEGRRRRRRWLPLGVNGRTSTAAQPGSLVYKIWNFCFFLPASSSSPAVDSSPRPGGFKKGYNVKFSVFSCCSTWYWCTLYYNSPGIWCIHSSVTQTYQSLWVSFLSCTYL